MNKDFPPLLLPLPLTYNRSNIRPKKPKWSPEAIKNRRIIADALIEKIKPLSEKLHEMSEAERKAVFFKLEHEGKIPLTGTGLKSILEPNSKITIAIPRDEDLNKLAQKINEFGGDLVDGKPQNVALGINLKTIVQGDPKDRLSQSLFEDYETLIKLPWVTFEIEIVSYKQGHRQQQEEIRSVLKELNDQFRGRVLGRILEQEEIKGTCRAVIQCTGKLLKVLVEDENWQVKISWFDSRPNFQDLNTIIEKFEFQKLDPLSSPEEDAPIVCIIDSGILPGNPFLTPVTKDELVKCFLDTENPERFTPYDEVHPYGHGSGVASLASYYGLNIEAGASNQGKVWIASARILDAQNGCDERLYSKMLREVVETFVPYGVKIFNLSVNSKDRKWHKEAKRTAPRNSWTARAIDAISKEFDVVFVVSTGNLLSDSLDEYFQNGDEYPSYFANIESSILDPAQAALALSVGSLAAGTLVVQKRIDNEHPIAQANHPSPFTRCGPGIKLEIKPELVEFGGNYLSDDHKNVYQNIGTNIFMASNKLTPAITSSCGTSFAAPRVSHKLALILSDLQSLGIPSISAPLLKAFAVNSASYEFLGTDLQTFIKEIDSIQPKHWLNIIGYGQPNDVMATYCDDYSALLYFHGEIGLNKVTFFDIPVPEDLADGEDGIKQLSITLAYYPEIQRWGLDEYLGTKLQWRIFRGDVDREEIIAAMSDETEEIFDIPSELNKSKSTLGINLRSRGTVQHDVYEWEKHQKEYSANHYTLAVASQERWNRKNPSSVPYALVVRLEDKTRSVPIYAEIDNILAQIEVRV